MQKHAQTDGAWFRGPNGAYFTDKSDSKAGTGKQPASSANDAAAAGWFRGQPQPETVDWFRGQPASSAGDAEIAGWFRGQPASAAKDPATVDWFRGQPASSAEDAEIAGWFRGQPAANDHGPWFRGQPEAAAANAVAPSPSNGSWFQGKPNPRGNKLVGKQLLAGKNWVCKVDGKSGKPFFFNIEDRVPQWEPPERWVHPSGYIDRG